MNNDRPAPTDPTVLMSSARMDPAPAPPHKPVPKPSIRVLYKVRAAGEQWEVNNTSTNEHHLYETRQDALFAARADARSMWSKQNIPTRVELDADGTHHLVALYGAEPVAPPG
jgi:hypothetical protein